MTRKQLFLNFKGGTGKTSLSSNYAFRLAEMGNRVLVVDLDSQGHATKCLGYEGRLATVGYLYCVMKGEMDIEALHSKRLKLFGVSNKMRNAAQRGVTVQGFIKDLLPLFASGKLKPVIDRVYAFKDLPEAKARMEADQHVGKIVVRI